MQFLQGLEDSPFTSVNLKAYFNTVYGILQL